MGEDPASIAGDTGSISGWGSQGPHAARCIMSVLLSAYTSYGNTILMCNRIMSKNVCTPIKKYFTAKKNINHMSAFSELESYCWWRVGNIVRITKNVTETGSEQSLFFVFIFLLVYNKSTWLC